MLKRNEQQRRKEGGQAYLMSFGRIIGSLAIAVSTSSINWTFHFNRCSCHTPRKPVRTGTKQRTAVVGVSLKLRVEVVYCVDDDEYRAGTF